MTQSKHTPGPWVWISKSDYDDTVYRELSPDIISPTCEEGLTVYQENACLIAAAPDLLEALKDMMTAYNEAHPAWIKAAAIQNIGLNN
jgi:hypothetical protein